MLGLLGYVLLFKLNKVVTMVFKLNKVVTMVFPGICEDRVCRGAWAMHALVVAICGLLNN